MTVHSLALCDLDLEGFRLHLSSPQMCREEVTLFALVNSQDLCNGATTS